MSEGQDRLRERLEAEKTNVGRVRLLVTLSLNEEDPVRSRAWLGAGLNELADATAELARAVVQAARGGIRR